MSARLAVDGLDAIAWAVNPQLDTVGNLADYLSEYAPDYLNAAATECCLDIKVESPNRPLAITVRHAALMAVKEALQNVVRHAGATTVWVSLRDAQDEVEISVTDDGRGISNRPVSVSHSGLESMRQRLSEVGGHCKVVAREGGSGTCVLLAIPTNKRN